MNRPETVYLKDEQFSWESSTSEDWSQETEQTIPPARRFFQYTKATVLAFLLLTSPATSINVDRWLGNIRRDTSTILGIAMPSSRRRITLQEARRIALKVMHEMENRRSIFADAERKRIMLWEESNDL